MANPFSQVRNPKCYSVTVAPGSNFNGPNRVEFPGVAVFAQIRNLSHIDIRVQLNDDPEAVFPLNAGDAQIFNSGDCHITSVDCANTGSTPVIVDIIVGVVS
jgi:hypothetical protein